MVVVKPNDFIFTIIEIYTNKPKLIPKKPAIYPSKINKNLNNLKWKPKEKSGIADEAIAVIATIIIRVGLTILALTAASPITNAPTIPIVEPIGEGTLSEASRISSKAISIARISTITGKGTFSLEASIEKRSSVGKISWW